MRGRPANENDPGSSLMLARLNRQPSYMAYYVAFVLSLAWIFGWSMLYSATLFNQPTDETVRSFALLILPIGIMWVMAYFLWRAQQLRQVSEVLMQSAMRLIRPQDIATEGLTSIAQAVRSEVDLLVGGVEHAVQRATVLEEIVHKEISAIERAFGGNEDRIRTLVTGLENQRSALHQASLVVGNESAPLLARLEINTQNLDSVVNSAQSTLVRFEQGLKNSTTELARTIDEVSARATVAGNEIGGQTTQMERMSGMLVGELRTFSQHLQEQIQTLSSAAGHLNAETTNFGRNVQGMESNVTHLLVQSMDQIKALTAEMSDVVQSSSGNITYHLKATSSEVASLIERSGIDAAQQIELSRGRVDQGLQNVAKDYMDKVARTHGDLKGYLDQAATQIVVGVEDATHKLSDRLSSTNTQFLTGLDQTANQLFTQLNAAGSGLAGKVEETTNRLFSEIGQKATQINLKLDETSTGVFDRLDLQANYVNSHIEETASKLYGNLDSRANALGTTIENNALRVFDAIDAQSEHVTSKLGETAATVAAKIDDATNFVHTRFEQADSKLEETAASFASRIDQATNFVHTRVDQASSSVVGQLQATGSNINDLLVTTSGTISSHLKETSDIVSRQMQDSGIALAQNIEISSGLVTDKMIGVSGEFIQKMGGARDDMFNFLSETSGQITSKMDETAGQLFARLDDTSLSITGKVTTVTENLTRKLDTSSTQLNTLLETTEERIGSQLDQASTELTALFTANTKMMSDQLDQTSTEVTNTFADTAVRVARQVQDANVVMTQRLEKTSTEVAEQLASAGNSMFTRIDSTARELGTRFDIATEILEKVTSDVSGRISGTGAKFAEILDTASSQMISDLGKASDAFSEGLGQTTLQISGRFEQETGLLVGRIDKAVKEFDSATSATNSQLSEAHRKFSKHVETANTYLADQLSTAASSIDDRLESISMQLTGKLEMTGSRISDRLEDVSVLVEKSIDKFNGEMENVLLSRKVALDSLIDDASKRAQEIDAVMTSYMTLIEDSLVTAEARAKDISRIIADQTNVAVGNLEQEIRKMEASSGGQITQASRVLREQHERAMASMNEMLSSTASDFQQTAQDMRMTAQQVVKDIDSARSDLKRAIVDLPEETRTNADAMRKVVADQIAALNTLADVVKRQTGMTDLSGPGTGYAPQRSTRDPSPGKSEGATFLAPQSGTSGALKKAMERLENKGASTSWRDAAIESPGKPQAKKAAEGNGVPREVESLTHELNRVARDIVDVLEDGLPAELEKRYNKNERHVYTQRLYEGRGKRLQKNIATRYENDRPTRNQVDSYVKLFERLLDTVAEAPQGNQMVEACLMSESGKIYVMLAEACGRISPS
ncbi:MAG TPA: hypothetical protein VM144_15870 [Aestuariivirga sp.]|nr:hypothetical protein [Aestuariivirga sp.]